MVADSITDSELFHGSPTSRDFFKKRKANWLWKLKQWKTTNARRKQWTSLWKRANNVGEEENGFRLRSLPDRKTGSERFSYIREWRIDDDDDNETDLERSSSSASSPTSVLKNRDSLSNKSGEDCFCCSKQVPEEEDEAFDDAFENFDSLSDALNSYENKGTELEQEVAKPSTSHRKKKKKKKSSATNLLQKDKREQGSSTGKAVQVQINRRNEVKSSATNLLQKDKCEEGSSTEKAVQVQSNKKSSDQQQKPEEKRLCPVCCEVMDETDLKFLPCRCGFLVCLFCHKQIKENDGKCPQCREKYGQTSTNSGEVSFQQHGGGKLELSSSFKGLDEA